MWKLIKRLVQLVILTIPYVATSQAWLEDRATREGPGIKLGDSLVFHPGAGAEGGYDTNALRESDDPTGSGRLRVTGYADLATRSQKRKAVDEGVVDATPPKVSFRLGIAGFYDWFFADRKVVDDQDYFGADVHTNLVVFPEGVFSLLVNADYTRTQQPYESANEHWSRNEIEPGVGFRLRPGNGTLTLELGYTLGVLLYEDDDIARYSDKMKHNVRFLTSWKILPKTALVSRVFFSPILYSDDSSDNVDSLPVRALFGIQGLVASRFGLLLLAGYGASFYDRGDDFNHVIAQGELMFFVTPMSAIKLGGQRDFVDSFYANFYVKNGGYLKYEQMFGGIFLAAVKGEVFQRDYSAMGAFNSVTQISSQRDEIWVGAELLLEVRATEWLSFHASFAYQGNISDFRYTLPDMNGDGVLDRMSVDFHKFEILGGVRFHY